MTLPIWPTEFDPPFRSSFSLSDGEGRLRTTPEAGPVRQRAKFSSVSKPVSLTFDFSRNELARFDRFYAEEVGSGVLPFLMQDFTSNDYPLMTIDGELLTDDKGTPLSISSFWLVQFGSQLPQRQNIGVRWQVSFEVEIMP